LMIRALQQGKYIWPSLKHGYLWSTGTYAS
jgi:hypothetical protein